MRTKRWLLALALPVLLGGCYVHGRGAVSYAYYDPPPPRYTYVDYRPGHVWVDGYWYWGYNDWAWRPGYYIAQRPGHYWVQGRYVNRRYQPGYWARGNRPVVRVTPHRSQQPARLHVSPQRRSQPQQKPTRVVIPRR
jgi:hypothetical protein